MTHQNAGRYSQQYPECKIGKKSFHVSTLALLQSIVIEERELMQYLKSISNESIDL
jgi:hypothetical protein